MMFDPFYSMMSQFKHVSLYNFYGNISSVRGGVVEIQGLDHVISLGQRCQVFMSSGGCVSCEIIGLEKGRVFGMLFGSVEGVGLGDKVVLDTHQMFVYPNENWLGRVIDGMAHPIDQKGLLEKGSQPYSFHGEIPKAHKRHRLGEKIDVGVRAINVFTPVCKGQRMGIFSGSGVGKSSLLSMLIRSTCADVCVVGLVGERGREAREFIEDTLGHEGMKKTILVVATSDEPALVRRQAAYLTLSLSEYFRDQGAHVLCLMDSVTRFAMAQREIGLAGGEMAATRGYTPSVFSQLSRLLERAGPGQDQGGHITGLFTVLVEGDDENEPICDTVRGTVDGHIVLDRQIAQRNRFPAINILKSLSRMVPKCYSQEEQTMVARARELLSTYENMADLIRLGAYRQGSDPRVDEAIKYYPFLENFLHQDLHDPGTDLESSYAQLSGILESGES